MHFPGQAQRRNACHDLPGPAGARSKPGIPHPGRTRRAYSRDDSEPAGATRRRRARARGPDFARTARVRSRLPAARDDRCAARAGTATRGLHPCLRPPGTTRTSARFAGRLRTAFSCKSALCGAGRFSVARCRQPPSRPAARVRASDRLQADLSRQRRARTLDRETRARRTHGRCDPADTARQYGRQRSFRWRSRLECGATVVSRRAPCPA